MNKVILLLLAVMVISASLAVAAWQGREVIEAYFEGREDVIQAQADAYLKRSTANLVQRQSTFLILIAGLLVLQVPLLGFALVLLVLRDRREREQGGYVLVREIHHGLTHDGKSRVVEMRPAELVRR